MKIINNRFIPEAGDVYKYKCDNDQGYGYMVPVKTSKGWDFIDTYHLDVPTLKKGQKLDDASIERILDLGQGEHDGYVWRVSSNYYHRNVRLGRDVVPEDFVTLFSLADYHPTLPRECDDYDSTDVILNVPLYHEQHFSWGSGWAMGLCFVRDDAKKSLAREIEALLDDALQSTVFPCTSLVAARDLEKAKAKFSQVDTPDSNWKQNTSARIAYITSCINAIDMCESELKEARQIYREALNDGE